MWYRSSPAAASNLTPVAVTTAYAHRHPPFLFFRHRYVGRDAREVLGEDAGGGQPRGPVHEGVGLRRRAEHRRLGEPRGVEDHAALGCLRGQTRPPVGGPGHQVPTTQVQGACDAKAPEALTGINRRAPAP